MKYAIALLLPLLLMVSCSAGSSSDYILQGPVRQSDKSIPVINNLVPEESSHVQESAQMQSQQSDKAEQTTIADQPETKTVLHLSAVGDIITHDLQIEAALQEDGTYDFKDVFLDIKPFISFADIAIGNLEASISTRERGFGGYPVFKTPEELLEAIVFAGFDVITTANNHCFDGGEFGVDYTLSKLEENGLLHTGTSRSMEERNRILLIEKKDIKLAILSYTNSTNGLERNIGENKLSYMVNYSHDLNTILNDVEKAKSLGSEIIIACMHWGDEYVREQNSRQMEMADTLFNMGIDIVLGSHPHMIQPMERKWVTDEDGKEREVFAAYSLGNFISNQNTFQELPKYTDSGIIVNIEIIKDTELDKVYIGEITYVPTWVHVDRSNKEKYKYRILPAGKYMEYNIDEISNNRIRESWFETTEHVGTDVFLPVCK